MTRPTAVLAAATLAVSSCASMQAERARREALTAQLDAFRYQKPLDEVWSEARRLLFEKGYPLAGADAEAVGQKQLFLGGLFSSAKDTRPDPAATQFLETGWGPGPLRYRVQGWANGSSARMVFWAIPEDGTEHGRDGRPTTRGLDLELELARRLEPDAAAAIEAALPPAPGG
ncbi:MAG TPA: hypothetical protein VFR85_03220 [Anaeromyxobacteraceae bacterium]|nr:hypothetical protein [Anaeromyxobacteraceae bacterium]